MEEMKVKDGQTELTGWAMVELLGHRRLAGHIETVHIGQAAFLKITIPAIDRTWTADRNHFWPGVVIPAGATVRSTREKRECFAAVTSVYCITPAHENEVEDLAGAKHEILTLPAGQLPPADVEMGAVAADDDEVGF